MMKPNTPTAHTNQVATTTVTRKPKPATANLFKALLVLCVALVLGLCAKTVRSYEQLLASGKVVFLALAPVDPRSLMQGDYMQLHYALDDDINAPNRSDEPPPAYAYLTLNDQHQATALTLGSDVNAAPAGTVAVRLRPFASRWNGRSLSATEFFFQEGQAAQFEQARWAEIVVRADGVNLLKGLRNAEMAPLPTPETDGATPAGRAPAAEIDTDTRMDTGIDTDTSTSH